MATIVNKRSGILLKKPSSFNATLAEFQTQLIDTFFIGMNHPIEYSPAFRKLLKEEYDNEKEINVDIDLLAGCNELLDKPGTLSFDLMLDYLIEQRELSHKDLREIVCGASIVCRRGVLSKLFNAPCKDKSEFQFAVKRFRGIYFIKEISTETYQKQYVKRYIDPHGFLPKFKKNIIRTFGDDTYESPEEVSTWEQMQGLFLCDLSLPSDAKCLIIFYGTEIDAFDNDDNVVEIKLQKGELNPINPTYYLAEKIRKWYFLSQLVGSDTVVVGFRSDTVVTSIKKIKNDTLPLMVKDVHRWNDSSSYNATVTVLSSIIEFYDRNIDENETLHVELNPKDTNILFNIRDDKIHNVLPDKFKEAFEDNDVYVDEDEIEGSYVLDTEDGWLDEAIEKALKI